MRVVNECAECKSEMGYANFIVLIPPENNVWLLLSAIYTSFRLCVIHYQKASEGGRVRVGKCLFFDDEITSSSFGSRIALYRFSLR